MDSQQSQVLIEKAANRTAKNRIATTYSQLRSCAIGRWAASFVSVGLSIAIFAQHPGKRLLIAAALNTAVGSLHLCLAFAPTMKPQAKMNPRPQSWYYLLVIVSSLLSLPAIILMFLFRASEENQDAASDTETLPTLGITQTLAIGCGCMGIIVLIWNLAQCRYIYQLAYTDFSVRELQEGCTEVTNTPKRASKNFINTII